MLIANYDSILVFGGLATSDIFPLNTPDG